MREVLASLKPYYYYLVGEGIKEVEVRKSIPKSNDWDKKVFFYMSKDEKSFAKIPKEYQEKYRRHFGKVGLQFVCDSIDEYKANNLGWYIYPQKETCLWSDEIAVYGKGKPLYGWHISDLVIYDKPKALSEFRKYCGMVERFEVESVEFFENCINCPNLIETDSGLCSVDCKSKLTRPPQSWCYVERTKNER